MNGTTERYEQPIAEQAQAHGVGGDACADNQIDKSECYMYITIVSQLVVTIWGW
jgi:hypothetical protein